MTAPDTCGTSGGAISLWYKVTECEDLGAVVTTLQAFGYGGTTISCDRTIVRLVAKTECIIVILMLSIALIQCLFIYIFST